MYMQGLYSTDFSRSAQDLSRRNVLKMAGAGLAVVTLVPFEVSATPESTLMAIEELIGSKAPKQGRIKINLLDIAENGGTVPMTVFVESPMTKADYVKSIHLFADGNPLPDIGTFNLGPYNGKAQVSIRIRLAKTQHIVAVAEMSNGETFIARRRIKVTIGGCGG
jgi:sulfur-oxidizing protein SoxY